MTDIAELKLEFVRYADSFLNGESENDFNINLKKNHSFYVADFCRDIAGSEGMDGNFADFSYSAGLLHDVARFEQYRKFKTFQDSISVDHGDLGSEIVREKRFSRFFDETRLEMLSNSVKYHNKKEFEEKGDESSFLTALVRDADKLDIYRVMTEMLSSSSGHIISHHLPDTENYSSDIVSDILNGLQICYTRRKTRNDMKLTVANWVQDLKFRFSFRHVHTKKYIETICSTLPQTEDIHTVRRYLLNYLQDNI